MELVARRVSRIDLGFKNLRVLRDIFSRVFFSVGSRTPLYHRLMITQPSSFLRLLCGLLCVLFCAPATFAQATYPAKPIRLIVPFPPGGGAEATARLIANKLSETLGQAVVVETRAGAGGNIGTEYVARAQPDGYTLLLATNGMAIQPHLQKLSWDPIKDFTPVGLVAVYSLVIAVHPSVAAQNLPELIAYAKAHPRQLTYGSSGSGGPLHMGAELFRSHAGIDLLHVPYKGNAPMTIALLSGEINMVFDSPVGPLPNIRAGKVRALATTGKRRSSSLPDVPTVIESGLPGFEYESWNGIVAPAGTPKDIVARLSNEVAKAVASPDVRERLIALGYEPRAAKTDDFAALIAADMSRFGRVVKEVGMKLD
jgi:tripartite-type tricarboxylate transporter receptor subunit TctC